MYVRAGNGVECDWDAAVSWIQTAATQGHAGAQSGLGFLYYRGHGVARDWGVATHWWALASAQGDVDAMTHCGDVYKPRGSRASFGLTHNVGTALIWYCKAVMNGKLEVQQQLDDGYELGLWDNFTWIRHHHRFLGGVVNRAFSSVLLGLQVFLLPYYNIYLCSSFQRLVAVATVPEFDPEMLEEALEHMHPFQLLHELGGSFWE